MVTTDPVKAAQAEAARQVDDRVALVRDLRDAVEAEQAVRSASAATKDMLAGLPAELADKAQAVRDAVAALLSAAGENTRRKRAAATAPGGWSTEQLRGFGLLPVRKVNTTRKIRTAAGSDEPGQPADTEQPPPATAPAVGAASEPGAATS